LVKTVDGLRIYGGGILSSSGETHYALDSEIQFRDDLRPIDALSTPYRVDMAEMDIMALVEEAKNLGLFALKFTPKNKLVS
jgi:phenylalanine-4-hydroxylase